jgi:hypothetical protein
MDTLILPEYHIVPVDPSLTLQEAWKELCIFGKRITNTGDANWALVRCDGAECKNLKR